MRLRHRADRWVGMGKLLCHGFSLIQLLAASVAVPLRAQQDACLERTFAVNVLTDSGEMVQGLTAQNFLGKMHGEKIQTTSAVPDTGPRRIAIVLDASADKHDTWPLRVLLAQRLVEADETSSFALVTFSGQVTTRIGFDQGRSAVANEVARLKSTPASREFRKTALRDALMAALEFFGRVRFGDIIYTIGDGSDNNSAVDGTRFTDIWNRSGARLFAVIPAAPGGRNRSEEEAVGPEWVGGYVANSGGDSITFLAGTSSLGFSSRQIESGAITIQGQRIIQAATAGFDHEIARPYRVTIRLSEPLARTRDWDLFVTDSNGRINRNLRILYPQKLTACQ